MKVIAITQRLVENETYREVRDCLDVEWAAMFTLLDFLPLILPSSFDFQKYVSIFQPDGFLLTGGNDLSAFNPNPLSAKRDHLEKTIIQYAINQDIPVFGVCRGMHLIADYFGSTFRKVEEHVGCFHNLEASASTRYGKYLRNIKSVNSYHNYCLDTLPGTLAVAAKSPDGVVEAIEHKSHRIFAQMWHPEREGKYKKEQYSLIKNFFEQKKKGKE